MNDLPPVYCPYCKKLFKGFVMIGGEPHSADHHIKVGSLWCGTCIRMIHFGAQGKDKKKRSFAP